MYSLVGSKSVRVMTLAILFATLCAISNAAAQVSVATEPILPIVEMQELIDRLATGVTQRHSISEQEFKSGVAQLPEMAKADRRVILEQLLLYHGQKRLKDGSMASGLGVGAIMREFDFQDSEVLSIMYPILQRSDAYWSDRIAHGFLDGVGSTDNPDSPDFTLFEQLIREEKGSSDEALYPIYRYMFRRSPGQAIRSMQSIYGTADGLDSGLSLLEARFGAAFGRKANPEEINDTDVAQVFDNLSQHREWWVRLFAARILEKQRDFADHGLTSKLETDTHPLVIEFAKEAVREVEREFTR